MPASGWSSSAAPRRRRPSRAGRRRRARRPPCISSPIVEPGQRRVLRRLVQHGVAGEQRGDEDVGADEVRIVPGRDVADDADRLVADLLLDAAVRGRRPPPPRQRALCTLARKKSMRPCSPLTSLRDCVIGLPISPVRVAARSSMRCCASWPKRARVVLRSSMRIRAHSFWPRAALANLRATASGASSATSRMTAPVAGFTTFRRAPPRAGPTSTAALKRTPPRRSSGSPSPCRGAGCCRGRSPGRRGWEAVPAPPAGPWCRPGRPECRSASSGRGARPGRLRRCARADHGHGHAREPVARGSRLNFSAWSIITPLA